MGDASVLISPFLHRPGVHVEGFAIAAQVRCESLATKSTYPQHAERLQGRNAATNLGVPSANTVSSSIAQHHSTLLAFPTHSTVCGLCAQLYTCAHVPLNADQKRGPETRTRLWGSLDVLRLGVLLSCALQSQPQVAADVRVSSRQLGHAMHVLEEHCPHSSLLRTIATMAASLRATFHTAGGLAYEADLSSPVADLSIPASPYAPPRSQVRTFGLPEPAAAEDYSVDNGASVNCPIATMCFHSCVTHTECVGHLLPGRVTLYDVASANTCVTHRVPAVNRPWYGTFPTWPPPFCVRAQVFILSVCCCFRSCGAPGRDDL